MGNARGPLAVSSNLHRDFEVFDNLPREVRDALNYAHFGYSAAKVLAVAQKQGWTTKEIKEAIEA